MAIPNSHDRVRTRWLGFGALLVILVLAAAMLDRRSYDPAEVLSIVRADRFTAGRLMGQSAWDACAVTDSSALVPRLKCDPPSAPEALRVSEADSSPEALHAHAMLELRVAADVRRRHQNVTDALRRALAAKPGDAGLLNDLAVAYLDRAERDQDFDALLDALDFVEQAAARGSVRPEILFNRALILQRMYLFSSAEQAWSRYLSVDRNSPWRVEAIAHLARARAASDTVSWTPLLGDTLLGTPALSRARIQLRVARSPQEAREFGFPLLAAWGAALESGDSARARRLLDLARTIGDVLRRDRSVAFAVDTIDAAAGDPERLRLLARGHKTLGSAFDEFEDYDNTTALALSEQAEIILREVGSPAAPWAAFYRAASMVNLGEHDSADVHLKTLEQEAGRWEPALKGKVLWARGLSRLRQIRYEEAEQFYRQAIPYIEEAREAENRGAIFVLLAEAYLRAGQIPAADLEAHQGLQVLAAYRNSKYLAYILDIVATNARASGRPHAALALTDEMVVVARAADRINLLTFALSARARDQAARGFWNKATRDLTEMEEWAPSLSDASDGNRLRAHLQLAHGQLMRVRDPHRAFSLLDSAIATYSQLSGGSDLFLASALYEGALAARAIGNPAQARAWLTRAMDEVESQRNAFEQTGSKAAYYETVENIFDEMVALELDEGHFAAAFSVLERGRVPLWGSAPHTARALTPEQVGAALPEGMLLVEYALLKDRLVIWTMSRQGTRQHTVSVSRDSIARLADRLAKATTMEELEDRASAAARLYDLLIRPLTPQLSATTQLTIVPDRELYAVPFAALWTPGDRFLVLKHTLRTVPSADFFLQALRTPRRATAEAGPLVVGNPALSGEMTVDLRPLLGAEIEAGAVAQLYPGTVPLLEEDARRNRVQALLPGASFFHFAGHAVFNARDPGSSYLALAENGPDAGGILWAREIAEMSLSNLEVVVLSACSTLGQRATRTGPAAGLAYSFLRAGAPATVSTLWDVSDFATAGLLVKFHQELTRDTPHAEALRQAQRQAIQDGITPRAWAAFVYTGP